jgi:antitoxin component YwqK of YwqJK toxin-antitoxin module
MTRGWAALALAMLCASLRAEVTCRTDYQGPRDEADPYSVTYLDGGQAIAEQVLDPKKGWVTKSGTVPDGLVREFGPDGNLLSERKLKHGKLAGPLRYFDASGNLRSEIDFSDPEKTERRDYFPSGKLKAKSSNHAFAFLEKTTYFENGNIESTFHAGDGTHKDYYPSGKLKLESDYQGNERTAEREYREDGSELRETTYRHWLVVRERHFDAKGQEVGKELREFSEAMPDLLFARQKRRDRLFLWTDNSLLPPQDRPLAGGPVLVSAWVDRWENPGGHMGPGARFPEDRDWVRYTVVQGKAGLALFGGLPQARWIANAKLPASIELAFDEADVAPVWVLATDPGPQKVLVRAELIERGSRVKYLGLDRGLDIPLQFIAPPAGLPKASDVGQAILDNLRARVPMAWTEDIEHLSPPQGAQQPGPESRESKVVSLNQGDLDAAAGDWEQCEYTLYQSHFNAQDHRWVATCQRSDGNARFMSFDPDDQARLPANELDLTDTHDMRGYVRAEIQRSRPTREGRSLGWGQIEELRKEALLSEDVAQKNTTVIKDLRMGPGVNQGP